MFKRILSESLLALFIFLFCLHPVFPGGKGESSGKAPASANREPEWVRNPYSKYSEQAYVAAVGRGSSRDVAEKDALGRLIAIFGQSIQVEEKVSTIYQEAVENDVTKKSSEDTTLRSDIRTSASLGSLVGAENGETWDDGNGSFVTIALLNRAKADQTYTEMIKSNQLMIDNLLDMTAEEKNSFEGLSHYYLAAAIADVNISYGNLLSVIGRPVQGLKIGDEYRLEAANIARAIPVRLSVDNDKSGRIQGAFAKAFSDLGFRSGGSDSRYVLDVGIVTSPVNLSGNPNLFTRIELKADLTDSISGAVLLPYDFNIREGHTSQSEADNRAYMSAERKINQEYSVLLDDYLSRLLLKK